MKTTVGQYITAKQLVPTGYNPINDQQEIESIYRTPAGDEMVVWGLGQGQIVNPAGGGSMFQSIDIDEFLGLPNELDWSRAKAF